MSHVKKRGRPRQSAEDHWRSGTYRFAPAWAIARAFDGKPTPGAVAVLVSGAAQPVALREGETLTGEA